MNKTININLGGYFFHIDEVAYNKLKRYLDAIGKSLSDDPQGKNEIIADIEARISELLSERIADARQVVNEQDISDIIKIMGEPEDYAESEEGYATSGNTYQRRTSSSKKLFRDGDDKFLGGVASGIAHYFDVDVIWIRLAFILFFIGGGFSLLLYILLWILLPEAKTTAEKLQMEGEAVNIDNIEKKIREEFSSVTETIKDGASEVTKKVNEGFKKGGKKAQSGFQDFLDVLGKIILTIFKIFGKFIGIIIIIVSASVLISFIIALFSIGSFEVIGWNHDYIHLPPFMYDSILPHWLVAICVLVLIGFPFLILFILGLRILSSSVRQLSKATSLSLLGIWIVALLLLIFTGLEFTSSKAHRGSKIDNTSLLTNANDTLTLNMVNDENIYYSSDLRRRDNRVEVYVGNDEKLYSNYVKLDVDKSDTGEAYIKVRKRSEGRNKSKANKSADAVDYQFKIDGNTIDLNAYFLTDPKNRIKDEVVYVTLYLPEGMSVYFDESTASFLNNVENTENIYDDDMIKQHFVMTKDGLSCTDCKKEEETTEEE